MESRAKDAEFSDVDRHDITAMLVDFMLAGTDTTANTVSFAIAELVNRPEIADRVYQEVSSVCGVSSTMGTEHLSQLTFTEAVIYETLRFHTIAPNGLPHRVTEEINIGGYTVPVNVRHFVLSFPLLLAVDLTLVYTFFD